MNPNDVVELVENYTTYPIHGPRVTFTAGQQFRVRHRIEGTGFVSVVDDAGAVWSLPVSRVEVVRKAKVKQ